MCGIAGYSGLGDRGTLEHMTRVLSHRGPDDEGYYIHDNVGFGHRRLSIIDLSPLGHQPMSNEDGTIWVVFNGEIYNFKGLRDDLISKGHTFRSLSDTEVIVHAYEEYGEAGVARLDGMFAFALWDELTRTLLIARDRMGKKPLYYGLHDSTFVFGSELKALYAYPYFQFALDEDSLRKYFFYDYIPSPHTPWKNVYKLESGHYAIYREGKCTTHAYWQSPWKDVHDISHVSMRDAQKELDGLLHHAVQERLVSDVPLGVFLSGGLDSSTIAWYAQQQSDTRLQTFSIDFKEPTYGEGSYARYVAKSLGTDHHEELLSLDKALTLIPSLLSNCDEPLADASLLPTYLLSKFTKEHVTVALSGDGADELFCGYPTFQAEKLYSLFSHAPGVVRHAFQRIVDAMPVSSSYLSLEFKLRKFFASEKELVLRHATWLGSFSLHEMNALCRSDTKELLEDLNQFKSSLPNLGDWELLCAYYQRFYMQERVLTKVDRASMAASLEVRSPFLATHVVEWANTHGMYYKMPYWEGKKIIRSLMRDRLPRQIVHRVKKGFGVPLGSWFRGELGDQFRSLATQENIEKSGILSYEYVMKLLDEHIQRRKNNGQKLWSLYVFLFWQSHSYGIK